MIPWRMLRRKRFRKTLTENGLTDHNTSVVWGVMKAVLLSLLCLPVVALAADAPRGSYKTSQFAEAREAAKAQGKALVYIETDSKTTCPKTEWGTKEAYKELRRECILVVNDESDPDNIEVKEMFPAVNETSKIGNSQPRITVVEPENLKFITGTDYRNMSSDKRWAKKMDTAISAAITPKKAEAEPEAKKPEPKTDPVPVYQDWTNKEGKTIRAAFVSRKADTVTLRLENGKNVEYAVDKLSDESKAKLPPA